MTRLKFLPYGDLRKVVEAVGFRWVRQVGSHNTFRNVEGRIVVVPDHGSQVIVRPLLRKIIRDLGLTIGEYYRIIDQM